MCLKLLPNTQDSQNIHFLAAEESMYLLMMKHLKCLTVTQIFLGIVLCPYLTDFFWGYKKNIIHNNLPQGWLVHTELGFTLKEHLWTPYPNHHVVLTAAFSSEPHLLRWPWKAKSLRNWVTITWTGLKQTPHRRKRKKVIEVLLSSNERQSIWVPRPPFNIPFSQYCPLTRKEAPVFKAIFMLFGLVEKPFFQHLA